MTKSENCDRQSDVCGSPHCKSLPIEPLSSINIKGIPIVLLPSSLYKQACILVLLARETNDKKRKMRLSLWSARFFRIAVSSWCARFLYSDDDGHLRMMVVWCVKRTNEYANEKSAKSQHESTCWKSACWILLTFSDFYWLSTEFADFCWLLLFTDFFYRYLKGKPASFQQYMVI